MNVTLLQKMYKSVARCNYYQICKLGSNYDVPIVLTHFVAKNVTQAEILVDVADAIISPATTYKMLQHFFEKSKKSVVSHLNSRCCNIAFVAPYGGPPFGGVGPAEGPSPDLCNKGREVPGKAKTGGGKQNGGGYGFKGFGV